MKKMLQYKMKKKVLQFFKLTVISLEQEFEILKFYMNFGTKNKECIIINIINKMTQRLRNYIEWIKNKKTEEKKVKK